VLSIHKSGGNSVRQLIRRLRIGASLTVTQEAVFENYHQPILNAAQAFAPAWFSK
jgi:hypothetical protein